MFCSRYDHQTEEETIRLRPCVLSAGLQCVPSPGCVTQRMCLLLMCPGKGFCKVCALHAPLSSMPFQELRRPAIVCTIAACLAVSGSNQAYRAISTSQLKALPLLHLWPIDVVVFHGSQGRPCFEGGFPLRCLQRLSCPNIATQHYRWHDNWSTSGSFTPVLSY